MGIARWRSNRESRIELTEMDLFADDNDTVSVEDHYSGSYFLENIEETMRSLEKNMKNTE